MLLRATRGHHGRLIAATAVIQVTLMIGMHWQVLPDAMRGVPAQREASSYMLYLIGGSVVACHVITEYATSGPGRRHHRCGLAGHP